MEDADICLSPFHLLVVHLDTKVETQIEDDSCQQYRERLTCAMEILGSSKRRKCDVERLFKVFCFRIELVEVCCH